MGAWGSGPFDNDEALDFATKIQSVDSLIDEVLLHDVGATIDVEKAGRIVVVAECVAAMRGHPHALMPSDLAQRLLTFGEPSDELFDNTRDSVSMVISNSELSELWAESEHRANFNRAMTDLIDRLNHPLAGVKEPGDKGPAPNPSPCWICGKEMGWEFTSVSITLDPVSGISQGGSVHLACLNAALHPRYILQDWQFDEAMLDRFTADIWDNDSAS
ncbi:MAG: DUF4259 domain-containing protein [Pseudomonadota bacterium]